MQTSSTVVKKCKTAGLHTCIPTPSLDTLAVRVEVEPLAKACVVDRDRRLFSPVHMHMLSTGSAEGWRSGAVCYAS